MEEAKTCLLLDLSHDEVSIVTHELCDPLRPLLAVHLHGLFTLCTRLAKRNGVHSRNYVLRSLVLESKTLVSLVFGSVGPNPPSLCSMAAALGSGGQEMLLQRVKASRVALGYW